MGQNVENKIFSVKCCLLAFNIGALGLLVVSLELFGSRAYGASYHAYHIYPLPVLVFGNAVGLLREIEVSVEGFLCFFHQFG